MDISPQMYFQQILCCILACSIAVYGLNGKDENGLFSDILESIGSDMYELLSKNPEKFYVDPESLVSREKRQSVDEVLSSSLWYSYRFGTGTGNREVLKVSGIREENWQGEGCNGDGVWLWKSLEVSRNKGLLLGLGISSLTLCSYRGTYSGSDQEDGQLGFYGTEFNIEILSTPTAAVMFETWNETSKMTDVIVVVATDLDKHSSLLWYRVAMSNERPILLELPNMWDLHKRVWDLQSFKINSDRKLLVLNLPEDGRKDSSVDIYGFIWEEEGKMDFWLVQKLFVHAASSIAVINVEETVFLGISQPDEGVVNIYKFDQIDNKFKRFQEIEAPGVGDIVSFYVGFSSFVAVAGKEPMLLRYDKEEFVIEYIDGIDKLGLVLHWLPVPIRTYRNEVVLIVETEDDDNRKVLSVVTWIGGHPGFSVKEPPTCYIDGLVEEGLSCMSNPIIGNEIGLESAAAISLGRWNSSLIIARPNGTSTLFGLEAHLVSVPSPVEKEIALLREHRQQINAMINKQLDTIKTAKDALEEILDGNIDIVIIGSWQIPSIKASKLIVSDGSPFLANEYDIESWKFGDHSWKVENISSLETWGINSLESKVESFASSVSEMKSNIEDAVPLVWNDFESVIVSSPHTFEGTINVSGTLLVENFQLGSLDEVEIEEILSNTVRLDNEITVSGHKVIKTLSVDNLKVIDKIRSTDVSALVFADDEYVVLEEVMYRKELKVHGDVFIPEGGAVNGLDLSEDIVAVNGTYDFSIGFVDRISSEQVWSSKLNKFPIDEDFASSIMRDDDVQVMSNLLMAYLEMYGGSIKVKNINGRDFGEFLSKLTFLNGGNVPGKTYSVECHAYMETYISSLNNLSFPDGFLMQKRKQIITGRKSFISGEKEGSLISGYLEVSGLVNGLNMSNFITLSTDQNLKNTSFYFTDMDAHNLQVFENANIPVENYKRLPLLGESYEVHQDFYFNDVEINGNLIIKGSLNEIDWEGIIGEIVLNVDNNISIEASKLVIKDLDASSLHIEGLVNGVDVSGFLTKDSEQTVVGKKTIGGNTVIMNVEVEDFVDGIDLKYIAENVVRISNQYVENEELKSMDHKIDGYVTFEDDVFIPLSFHTAVINDLHHLKAAFISIDQEFMGGAELDSLEADSAFIEGSFNPMKSLSGVNITEFDVKRFSLTKPQVVDGDVFIRYAIIDGDLKTDLINEKISKEMDVSSLIALESDPNIKYHIKRMTVNGAVQTSGIGIYNLQVIQDNAIWIDEDNFIEGRITFIDGIVASSVNITQSLNGYDLKTFLEDVVLQGEKVVVSGPSIFVAGLKVEDLITLSMNGRRMENILTTCTNQKINETLRIKGDVLVDGKVTIGNGKINGFELSDFTDRYEWRNGVHILRGDVILEDSTNVERLKVVGLVNTVDWGAVLELATFVDDHVEFIGNITFENEVLIEDDLFITKTIDGIDFEGMFGLRGAAVFLNYKRVTSNRLSYGLVESLMRFKDDVVVNNILHVYGDMTAESVYGCDLKEWAREAIYLDQSNHIPGIKIFNKMKVESDIEVGMLNYIDPSKMISLSANQEFLKQLNFKNLFVTNDRDVAVGISLNGFDLMGEYRNTLLVEGDQLISGQKKFRNIIRYQSDVITNGTLNYMLANEIVTLQTEQNITGLIEAGVIMAKQDVITFGFINEKDFNRWTDLAVNKDCSTSSVSGTWIVKGNVTFIDEIIGEGTLDGVNISRYHELSYIESGTHQMGFKQIEENLDIFCKELEYIEGRAINQPALFKELEAVQNIRPRHKIQNIFTFSAFDNNYLVLTYASTCGGEIRLWDSAEGTFDFPKYLNFAGGSEWHYLGSTNDNALLVVGSDDWRECKHPGYNIWRFDPQLLQFEHIQNIGDINSLKVLIENKENLLYTLEDEGIYQWTVNKDGDYLEKSQYLNETEFLNLKHEKGCITSIMAKYNETGRMNDEEIRKLIQGFDNYVILNISANLTLGAHFVPEDTVVKGSMGYIEVYDLSNGSLFTKWPSFNPDSLIAIDFGHNKQKMLAFVENGRRLKIYEYNGIEGFKEHLSFRAKFSQISSVSLRMESLFSPLNFLLASNETHVIVFKVLVVGDPLHQVQSLECSAEK